jgi:hypothetical protein
MGKIIEYWVKIQRNDKVLLKINFGKIIKFINKIYIMDFNLKNRFFLILSYKYAEELSPVIVYSQNKLLEQLSQFGGLKSQVHFERLKAELGRYPRVEDLFFISFKIEIDPSKVAKLELGVKIDPHLYDTYKTDNKSKELISVPLNTEETLKNLKTSLENSLYTSRALMHARRLLSVYLLTQTNQMGIFYLQN